MYRITQALSVGRYASPEREGDLLAAGVTHILNVSHAASRLAAAEGGFREVVWIPLDDSTRMPIHCVRRVLDELHRLASQSEAHVYVHCVAGHLRSPTVLWLYLIACGIGPENARGWIEKRSPDAAPGSRQLVSSEHILFAQRHGFEHFLPLSRLEIVVPAPLVE
jgi:protein-tyrosine phosphatase